MSQLSYRQQTATGADINFTIDTFSSDELKVYVDGVLKTAGVHYNINPYNSNSQSTVDWTTGNAPSSPSVVRIVRETDILNQGNTAVEGRATYAAGSSVKADDLNNNQKQVLRALQEHNDQLIQTYDVEDSAITTAKIKADNITNALIADDQIDSEHYVTGSIDLEHMSANSIDSDQYVDGSIDLVHMSANSVDSDQYVDGSIDRVHLASGIIDGSKIDSDAVDSVHIAAGAVDLEHMSANSVDSNQYVDGSIDGVHIANDQINSQHYVANSIDNEHLALNSVTRDRIVNDAIDQTKIDANAINSTHYQDGSINSVHLEADIIDSTKLADNAVSTEHIATGSITSAKLSSDAVITASEQGSATTNDTSFLTSAAADARFFNISSGDTIKDGQTFPDNDTTIATTAAINDRIIDLVDDVGGFVPIANETSFPTANPDVNNGTGTIVSVSAASTNLAPSGTTVTIANGAGTGNTVTITGVSSTIPSGFGFLVETTTTLHTYTFHRLSPKATEVTTVAGKATEIGLLGTAAVVEDMGILGTTDVVADMAILGTTDVVADLNTLGTADVVADLNTLGTADVVADMNILGTSANVTAMSNCSGSISSINNASSNLSSINNFGDKYQIASSNPSTDGGGNALAAGDLYFNTSANELKIYTGSAWVSGVTQTGNFALTTGNTFTGNNIFTAHNTHNDSVESRFGTDNDMQISHNGSNAYIVNKVGELNIYSTTGEAGAVFVPNGTSKLYFDGTKKLETKSNGVTITGEAKVTTDLVMNTVDNQRIYLGAGNDLQIYHDGTDNHLDSIGLINVNGTTGVHLQYNGTARVQTTASGTSIQGASILNGAVTFMSTDASTAFHFNAGNGSAARFKASDNAKIVAGSGEDLQLYHDGSNSYLNNTGTGVLILQGNGSSDVSVRAVSGESGVVVKPNGGASQVQLYYDNSKKFQTESYGGSVTGTLVASGNIKLGTDTGGFYAGAGDDLLITHTGSFAKIQNNANGGDLNLYADTNVGIYNAAGSETKATFATNGAVKLYFDNTKRFETTNSGVDITGALLVTNGITLPDSKSLKLGNNDDLQIFHDGTNGIVRTVTNGGTLYLQSGSHIELSHRHSDNSEEKAIFSTINGAVDLYHNGSKKLETSSSGITVTGDVDPTGDVQIGGDFKGPDNSHLFLGTGQDINIYHDGTDSYFYTGAGTTTFRDAANEKFADFVPNGAVKLFYDNSQKFATDSGGCTITGGVDSTTGIFERTNNGTSQLEFSSTSSTKLKHLSNGQCKLEFIGYNSVFGGSIDAQTNSDYIRIKNGADEQAVMCRSNGTVELYYDNSKKLEAQTQGVFVSGSLGVNRSGTPRAFNHASSGVTGTQFEAHASDASASIFETACFRGGNDGNGAGARVRICHDGDRGMVLDGGRTSNAAFGKISITDQNGTITESVHINSSGTWFWGKTSQSSGTPGVELYKDGPNFMTRAANGGTVLGLNDSTGTNGDIMRFYYQDVHRGSLNFNGSNFAAVNASDYRLKENDTPISDGITRVKQLRPIRFNWKTDSSTIHDGFFAHEVQNVVPAAVIGEKDSTIGSRGEGYQMMSNEPLIPLLTAALKDAISKIEILETKVAALEAA